MFNRRGSGDCGKNICFTVKSNNVIYVHIFDNLRSFFMYLKLQNYLARFQ